MCMSIVGQTLPYEQKIFFSFNWFCGCWICTEIGISTTTSTFSSDYDSFQGTSKLMMWYTYLFCSSLCFGFLVLTSQNQLERIFMQIYILLPLPYTTIIRLLLSCLLRRWMKLSVFAPKFSSWSKHIRYYDAFVWECAKSPKNRLCRPFVLLWPWICFCIDLPRWLQWWTYKVWLVFYFSCWGLNLPREAPFGFVPRHDLLELAMISLLSPSLCASTW